MNTMSTSAARPLAGKRILIGKPGLVAIDEGVDALGLSILSGSHRELVNDVLALLSQQQAGDIKVFVGGTIPQEDQQALRELGVAGVYTSDMHLDDVVASLADALA
jgi:methylmalonyl-CoA mutase C-terminal domain/subunit